MLLALDTATRWMGLALHDGQTIVSELGWQSLNTQTIDLAPALQTVFDRARISAADLKGIGVAIGPCSYTGLRVGLSLAKGLSLAHRLPLLAVPTLDIVAAGIGYQEGPLVVVAEAGRTRICAGRYRWHKRHGWQPQGAPDILTWDQLLVTLAGPTFLAGEIDAAAARQIKQTDKAFQVMPASANVRRAGYLAQIAWNRLRRGQVDDAAALSPIYLRDPAGSAAQE